MTYNKNRQQHNLKLFEIGKSFEFDATKEILIPSLSDTSQKNETLHQSLNDITETLTSLTAITTSPYYPIEPKSATEKILTHFNIQSLSAFGISEYEPALPAAWAILDYVKNTQKNNLLQITKLTPLLSTKTLYMDTTTIRNLELTTAIHQPTQHNKDAKKSTLFSVLNATKTACGARKL
jgi:DNA mismatch repair protein MutS